MSGEDVKPILKRSSVTESVPVQRTDSKRHMKWDEDNLRENAEYMVLNPKMKILEPDTPYNEYSMEKDEELIAAEKEEDQPEGKGHDEHIASDTNLQARLVMVQSKLFQVSEDDAVPAARGEEATSPTTPQSTPKRPCSSQHDEEFKMKRRAVYADEGAKFKALLQKGIPDDDEDEDDE